jgi:hypothetical protein
MYNIAIMSSTAVIENTIIKDPDARSKNQLRIRGLNIPQMYIFRGVPTELLPTSGWQQVVPGQGKDGVEYIPFELKGKDPLLADGAKVKIPPGKHTPIQFVGSETTFSEVPISGKLLFLCVSSKGELSMRYFQVSEHDNSAFQGFIAQGSIMCWYACLNQPDAYVLEHEEPGFSSSDLQNIQETDIDNYNGTPIPREFWIAFHALEEGQEKVILQNLE